MSSEDPQPATTLQDSPCLQLDAEIPLQISLSLFKRGTETQQEASQPQPLKIISGPEESWINGSPSVCACRVCWSRRGMRQETCTFLLSTRIWADLREQRLLLSVMSESPWRCIRFCWHKQACSWPTGCIAQRPRIHLTSHCSPSSACTSSPSSLSVLFTCPVGRVRTSHPRAGLYASSSSLLPLRTRVMIHLDQCCYPTWRYTGMPASHCWPQLPNIKPKPWVLPPGLLLLLAVTDHGPWAVQVTEQDPQPEMLTVCCCSLPLALPKRHHAWALPSPVHQRRNKLPPGGLRLSCSLTPETSSICSRQISRGISCAAVPNSATWWFPLGCPHLLYRPRLGFQLAWILRALSSGSKTPLLLLLPMPTACQHSTAQIILEKRSFLFLVQSSINTSFFFPPTPAWSKQVRQGPGPRMSFHTSTTRSNLKHNFSSFPPIFQDNLGTLQKNYGFATSTATPSWKFVFKHNVQSSLLLPLLLPLQDKRRQQAKCWQKKKVIKLVRLLHLNRTILGKEKVDITPASPYCMSELHRNRRPDQENKLEGPGPETVTEAQQQVSKRASKQASVQAHLAGVSGVQQ